MPHPRFCSGCGFFTLFLGFILRGPPKIDFFQMFNYLINLKSIFAH
jgi:hypothetical protein